MFLDEVYLCLCTDERHANCLMFDQRQHPNQLGCYAPDLCSNGGRCLQDHPRCPSTRICVCPDCFFGDRCQYYAKGLGATLDEILGYEIQFRTAVLRQPVSVQLALFVTVTMCLLGLASGLCSILTFSRPKPQEVGCGLYLWASSISSLCAVILFTVKLLFLYVSYQDVRGKERIVRLNCLGVEPALKLIIQVDHWYNACVAIERSISVYHGIQFNKKRSKQVARYVIGTIPLAIILICMPQLLQLHVFYDTDEERHWCVINYRPWLHIHSSVVIFFHYFAPLLVNISSALFIIIATARQRSSTHGDKPISEHLTTKLKKYKHLLLSPLIIVLLTLPHLIISILLDCKKSSTRFWFYLTGYLLSILPAVLVFVIFAAPSPLYKDEFRAMLADGRRKWRSFIDRIT